MFHSCKEGSIHFQPIKDCLLHHIKCIPVHSRNSTPFHNIPPRSIAFHSVKKKLHSFPNRSGTFYCVTLHMIAVNSTTLYCILEHLTVFCGMHSIKESSICVETTQELYTVSHYMDFYTKSAKLHLTPKNSTMFYSVPFCQRRIHSSPKQSLTLYCVTVYPIPLHSIAFDSIRQ